MEKEDKIAFSVLSLITGAVIVGLLLLVKFIGTTLFGFFTESSITGLGFKDSFVYAIILSTLLITVFAIFAGDGVLGELPTVVISFFLFTIFFTFAIVWIF
tara:strand:+ start:462 stop:764 length:303 start_codon:yes stop_codon:yes gene_type:complete